MNNTKNPQGSIFWSAVAGAALGASAIFLSDKKNRDLLKKRFNSFLGSADELRETGKEKINEEISKTKSKIKKIVEE